MVPVLSSGGWRVTWGLVLIVRASRTHRFSYTWGNFQNFLTSKDVKLAVAERRENEGRVGEELPGTLAGPSVWLGSCSFYTEPSKGCGCNTKACISSFQVKWLWAPATFHGFSCSLWHECFISFGQNPTFSYLEPIGEWSLYPPNASAERRGESRKCYFCCCYLLYYYSPKSQRQYSEISMNFDTRLPLIKGNRPVEEDVRACKVKEF